MYCLTVVYLSIMNTGIKTNYLFLGREQNEQNFTAGFRKHQLHMIANNTYIYAKMCAHF